MTRPHRLFAAASAVLVLALSTAAVAAASAPPDAGEYGTVTVTGAPLPTFSESVQSGDADDPAFGLPVPVVAGADYTGRPVTIDAATHGPTLVVLVSHWCPHCNELVDTLAEWRRTAAPPKELRIVGISVGADPDLENYPPSEWLVSDADWRWPVIADDVESSALRAYGGISFPMLVFVSSSGTMMWRTSGAVPLETLTTLVDGALAAES